MTKREDIQDCMVVQNITLMPIYCAMQAVVKVHLSYMPGGGGGGTWVFRGRIRSLSKLTNTPKALISGQKSTLILIKR